MSTAPLEQSLSEVSVNEQTGIAASTDSMQLVSFKLDAETYGIEITKIREIILVSEITAVPQSAHYIRGLINLRGTVIPVMDLRARFGLASAELTDESRIIVINVGKRVIGITVDEVSEVLRVSGQQISAAPPTVASLGNEYLAGLIQLEDQILMLLDVEHIFDTADEAAIEAATSGD
jgi:purine-binding chemotaxis protein CheW